MIRSKLGGLVLLNIVLLGALALVSLSPNSAAVADGRSSTRGEYVAISGTIAGTKTPVIWVVNQASQELVVCKCAWFHLIPLTVSVMVVFEVTVAQLILCQECNDQQL